MTTGLHYKASRQEDTNKRAEDDERVEITHYFYISNL